MVLRCLELDVVLVVWSLDREKSMAATSMDAAPLLGGAIQVFCSTLPFP